MLGGSSSLLCGCHSPVEGEVCSLVVGVEALRVRFDKTLLPLSVCSVPKEVSSEASEAGVVTADLCTAYVCIHGSAQKQPKVMPLSPLCSSEA